ncbi:hypothetical protein M6D93_14730 [Jatrophihabitans telluris]|uniref:DNA-3-methyladenine glycosylase 2 family protein n=1 Tax=Jatrophihabitans telluris TaxID=2038343 RepID=A0ABY4QWN8_9ACTN|nr:hypothetical protein [Jatrophihabitans telluris]UQX87547.1 hypothetical protein M6D93_14730 [Jatrophihabitans telluris]
MTGTPELLRRLPLSGPLDLARTLGLHRRSSADPSMVVRFDGLWRASRTPVGPATLVLSQRDGVLTGRAWGPGADWTLDGLPLLVGETEAERAAWAELDLTRVPHLAEVRRTRAGVHLSGTRLVLEALVPGCLEQRVTGGEAWRAWRGLLRRFGEPAPVPAARADAPELWLMPAPSDLLAIPTWEWHRLGVDSQRYRSIRAAGTVARRLEESVSLALSGDPASASRRLRVVPGVGEWTAAEVALRAWADPDAVSVGDFHLKNLVGYALAGAVRTTDETMLELLAPWRGHRARIVRLIELSGRTPQKFGPRFSPNDIRAI